MKWIELWAKLEVYGILIGIALTIIVFIIYAIMIWRANK